ncbi:hypothetical protein TNCV_4925611 [Trichonephila clavipes]|nr:hypothetical protein TNCV_4925611 [Trichonephila clavipes]
MSDSSEQMEFSPTKFEQVATCEKLRDTVTGILALHKSLHEMDGRSLSPRNSYKDLYLSSTQAMIRRKEELIANDDSKQNRGSRISAIYSKSPWRNLPEFQEFHAAPQSDDFWSLPLRDERPKCEPLRNTVRGRMTQKWDSVFLLRRPKDSQVHQAFGTFCVTTQTSGMRVTLATETSGPGGTHAFAYFHPKG